MAGLARLGAVGGQGEADLGNGVLRKPLRSTAPLVNISGDSLLPLKMAQKQLQKFGALPSAR